MNAKRFSLAVLLLASGVSHIARCQPASTLSRVRERGYLLCGVDRAEAEYSSTDEHGSRVAFDRDLCKAVALAALGPKAKILVTLYADEETSLRALVDGKADMIASVSNDFSRIENSRIVSSTRFTGTVLQDPISLMVARSSGVRHATELSGKLVCLLSETNVQDKVQKWFDANHLNLLPFPFQEEGEMEAAFVTGRCAAIAGDLTRVAETRVATGTRAADYVILPDVLARDPLAIAYRAGDPTWQNLVEGTRNLLFMSDRINLTSNRINLSQTLEDEAALTVLMNADECHGLTRSQISVVLQNIGTYSQMYGRDLASITTSDLR